MNGTFDRQNLRALFTGGNRDWSSEQGCGLFEHYLSPTSAKDGVIRPVHLRDCAATVDNLRVSLP